MSLCMLNWSNILVCFLPHWGVAKTFRGKWNNFSVQQASSEAHLLCTTKVKIILFHAYWQFSSKFSCLVLIIPLYCLLIFHDILRNASACQYLVTYFVRTFNALVRNNSYAFVEKCCCLNTYFNVFHKSVAMEPPMNLLISKLIQPHHLTCGSNKVVSLSLKRCCAGTVVDAFQVSCANGFQFVSHLVNLGFRSSDWLHVSIHGTSFSLLFSKLSVKGLGLRVSIRATAGG